MQALPIAEVHPPQGGPRYIAHARSHHGLVVQRRYRGVGAPRYSADSEGSGRLWKDHNRFAPHLVPFLNPGAVQAAGLSAPAVMRWSAAHPGHIFAHPTYAALCLRWGENPYGYRVEELEAQPLQTNDVPFTPHTCWHTGTTYYEFALASADGEAVHRHLLARGLLRAHARELGQEGTWAGWYATDRPALEQALGGLRRRVVLAQTQVRYGVWLGPGPETAGLLAQYATAEEARAHFDGLPGQSSAAATSVVAAVGCLVQPAGQPVREWCFEEKPLAAHHAALLAKGGGLSLIRPVVLSGMTTNLAEQDRPLTEEVPLLTSLLTATGLPRPFVSQALGWPPATVQARERDPSQLTLAEVAQLARLTRQSVPRLVADLREEVRAKQAVGLLAREAPAGKVGAA